MPSLNKEYLLRMTNPKFGEYDFNQSTSIRHQDVFEAILTKKIQTDR